MTITFCSYTVLLIALISIIDRNMMFSTKDHDNDIGPKNCAVENKGAWWYHRCLCSNPNGLYKGGGRGQGVVWRSFKGLDESLKHLEMKFRPNDT